MSIMEDAKTWPDPYKAAELREAERAVVETAIKRHMSQELIGPLSNAHNRAVAELLRLRAAQESGTQEILDK